MPRKTAVPREEIKEKAIEAAKNLAVKGGLNAINIRAIAAEVGCSVGTLYNVVGDQDTITLLLNRKTTIELTERLKKASQGASDPVQKAAAMSEAYITMGLENPNLWRVLFEFTRNSEDPLPGWYLDALAQPVLVVTKSLEPLYTNKKDLKSDVAIIWSGLHGIVALVLANKYRFLGEIDPLDLGRQLVHSVLGKDAQKSQL